MVYAPQKIKAVQREKGRFRWEKALFRQGKTLFHFFMLFNITFMNYLFR